MDLALAALNNSGKLGVNSKVIALRGYVFARTGRREEAQNVLQTLLSIAKERYVPPYAMAIVHAGLGEFELALQWLERCYDARDVHLIFRNGGSQMGSTPNRGYAFPACCNVAVSPRHGM